MERAVPLARRNRYSSRVEGQALRRRSALKRAYWKLFRSLMKAVNALGLNVARTRDFYSPLPVIGALERHAQRWKRPSALAGVDYDLEAMKARLTSLLAAHGEEWAAHPSYAATKRSLYGPGFTEVDAQLLYLMVRAEKPRRVIEVGSGLSSYYLHLAGVENAKGGRPLHLTSIDPFPFAGLARLAEIEVVPREVQDVDFATFGRLGAGDLLFIDSTHVVKIDGDVPYLFLEVIPRLAPGVLVHVHDVHFPWNVPYPPDRYVLEPRWPTYWTEAMLLQAFLAFNRDFEIVLSAPLLRHHDEAFLQAAIPGYRPVEADDFDTHFGSLWMRRRE